MKDTNNNANQTQIGAGIALIFSIIGFILALHDIFSTNSTIHGAPEAWFAGLFSLLAVIFSGSMFTTRHVSIPILTVIAVIITGIIGIYAHSWWLVICMAFSLIGSIIHMSESVGDDANKFIQEEKLETEALKAELKKKATPTKPATKKAPAKKPAAKKAPAKKPAAKKAPAKKPAAKK